MKRSKTKAAVTSAKRALGALCLLAACLVAAGCGRHEPETNAELENAVENQVEETKDRPVKLEKLTAEALLRETLATYAAAKYYSDEGVVEIECELEPDREPRSYRVPCAVTIAKPNYLRARLGSSLLTSDGKTMRAEILTPEYKDMRMEQPAPLVVASVREFYPDPEFAEAANLGVPLNLFWTAPQLALLFARDPKKTLVPIGAKLKLLEPEYLDRPGETPDRIPCDRLSISADDGERIVWISRASKTVARCELPVEQTAAPNADAKAVSLTIDLPRQKISDAAPSDLSEFQLAASEKKIVERFFPPELAPLGKVFPQEALRPWSNDAEPEADAALADDGRKTLLFFWRASDANSRNFNAFQAFAQAAQYSFPEDKIRFVAVECDGSEESGDVANLVASSLRAPLARLDRAKLAESGEAFSALDAPSFLLLDARGVVEKYIRRSFSFVNLQRTISLSLNGRGVASDDVNAYRAGARRFAEFIESADERDVYRTTTDFADPIAAPERQFPKTFRLREAWRFDDLTAPCNPLAVSKAYGAFAIDLSDDDEQGPEPKARADEGESEIPDDALVVPCDGNALAILTSAGKLVRKTTPRAAQGEPIDFVRTIAYGDGKRYYAAAARGRSRKIFRFDENFNDLGALDVGRLGARRVGDLRFADVDGDGAPDLIASLLGDPTGFSPQTNGLYAIDQSSRKTLWKFESILAPRRFEIFSDVKGTDYGERLFALDFAADGVGALAELDPRTGSKVGELRAADGGSIRALGSSNAVKPGAPKLAALAAYPGSGRASFVGFDSEGEQVWRSPAPRYSDSAMERVAAIDLDGDGYDEWILASPDGSIQFFSEEGRLVDLFEYGEEITGVCSAQWDGETYLVVADLHKVTAWKLERRHGRSRRSAQDK